MALDRSTILGKNTRKRQEVEVPEWGGTVWVSELSGKERDNYEAQIFEIKNAGKRMEMKYHRANIRARLLVLAIVDDSGQRMFADSDIDALGDLGAGALDKLFTVAQELSGFTDKDVEELEGN